MGCARYMASAEQFGIARLSATNRDSPLSRFASPVLELFQY